MPAKKLIVTGMPVDEAFRKPMAKEEARSILGIPVNAKVYMIMTGGIGCGDAISLCDALLTMPDEDALIIEDSVDIPITAVEAGVGSNVRAGSISIAFRPITGVVSIANAEAVTGGTDIEDDETYRERILEAYRAEAHFTGCPADYVRWAREVSGVGFAVCIPEWDGPGTVKLVISDSNGEPASQAILSEVYEHIMSTSEASLERLAPIGATLTVVAPSPVGVTYTCYVKIERR